MIPVRLPTLGTPGRLLVAAALCIVPMGLVWSTSVTPGFITPGMVGPSSCDADGYCAPGIYTPGVYVAGISILEHVSQAPVRLFLVVAAVVFVVAAVRVRTPATRRLVRIATVLLGIAAVLALGQRAVVPLGCVVLALALVVPLVWRIPRPTALARRQPAG